MTPFLLLGLGMAIVLLLVIWLKVHPFLDLIIAATVVSFATPEKSLESYADNYTQSQQDRGKMDESQALQFKKDFAKLSSMKRVVQEFGGGCAKVGLIIAFAALIGKCMLESGAAECFMTAPFGARFPLRTVVPPSGAIGVLIGRITSSL